MYIVINLPYPSLVSSLFSSSTHPSLFVSFYTFPNPFLCFQSILFKYSPLPFISLSTFPNPFLCFQSILFMYSPLPFHFPFHLSKSLSLFPVHSLHVLTPPFSFPFPPFQIPFSVSSPISSCSHPYLFISLSTFQNSFLCFQSVSFKCSPPPLFLSFSTFSTPFSASIPSSSNAQSPHSYPSPSSNFYIFPNLISFHFTQHFSGHFPLHHLICTLYPFPLVSFQPHFSISPFNKSPFLSFSSVLLPI